MIERSEHLVRIDLKPERRAADPFGRLLAENVECTVRAVSRHHLIVQIKDKNSPDSYRLVSADEETPFSETDFEVMSRERAIVMS